MDAKTLYLDLMKRSLTNMIYSDREYRSYKPWGKLNNYLVKDFFEKKFLVPRGAAIVTRYEFDEKVRSAGRDHSPFAHTMIGLKRLDNVQACVETVIKEKIPGDLIETGVWRGGSCIFMRAILQVHGVTDRTVWVADSFEGLPRPDEDKYPQDKGDTYFMRPELAVSLETVKSNFEKYGLLDDQVKFLKGWFKDSLPGAPIQKLAVLRLDGDMYESTMDAITNLYDKLSPGGFLIVDDYSVIDSCKTAITDFRTQKGITEEIIPIDGDGVFWRKK